jgi:hypothetical protein
MVDHCIFVLSKKEKFTYDPSTCGVEGLDSVVGQAYQSLPSVGCDIISESSLSHFSSICHRIHFVISSDRNNCFSLGMIGI